MPNPVSFDITTRRVREVWTGCRVAELTPEQLAQAWQAGYEPDGDYLIGRDPRQMASDELVAMGFMRLSPLQTIRAKCLDCCAGSADEVRKCPAKTCPSWLRRMGTDPWREISEAQREHGRRLAAQQRQKSLDPGC